MPPLRFVPYREIGREIDVRRTAGRQGGSPSSASLDPLRPWDEDIIGPSRGVAEAITAELLAHFPRGVAGLQMRTLDELAGRIHGVARVASDAERRLAMRMASRVIDD